MTRSSLQFAFVAVLISFYSTSAKVEEGLKYEEQVFDFGHIGVDFKVVHTFQLVNGGRKAIRITGVHAPCDCSAVAALDSIIRPGDTGFFRLTFSTKDYYGPTYKSFKVFTDHPKVPELQYSYQSIVGQWLDRIKPDPISVFFLPAQKARKITIANTAYDEISLTVREQYDTTFEVTLWRDKAVKGEALELEIAPRANLKTGTYRSNVTLVVEKKGLKDPTILTIPVKIVRY